jgi:alpha-glucosidase
VSNEYDGDRAFVGEAWVDDAVRQAAYTRPDELHTTFNFVALHTPWDSQRLRDVIHDSVTSAAAVGAPATWVLSNHDVVRPVSRLAPKVEDGVADIVEGRRRAVSLSLTFLALPGSCYIYQGEELGLDEVRELDDELRQDPAFWRSKGADGFRDGCRVPIPWSGSEPPFGFSSSHSWLRQPVRWAGSTAALQLRDPTSVLAMYRRALSIRRSRGCMGDGVLRWLDAPTDVVAFERPGADCVRAYVNLSTVDVEISDAGEVLVATDAAARVAHGVLSLPASAACWVSD